VAKNRVRGEIILLRMKAEHSQNKVSRLDEEMERKLKESASGFTLEFLEDLWKTDCKKEEDRSFNRWRYTETWLLDYANKYGMDLIKPAKTQRTNKVQKQKMTVGKQAETSTYAAAVSNNIHFTAQTSDSTNTEIDSENRGPNYPHYSRSLHENARQQRPFKKFDNTRMMPADKRPTTFRKKTRQGNANHSLTRRYRPRNIYWDDRTAYIGRGVQHHFLGGGKPSLGQRYIRPFHHQVNQI
jgi:hypothetical protein